MTGIVRHADGAVEIRLEDGERALLAGLAAQLIEIIETRDGARDPALDRLFPDAYAHDEAAAAEFRRLAEEDIALAKTADARVLVAALDERGRIRLGPSDALAWLRTLTALRLTMATRLGIEHDGDEGREEDPSRPMTQLYLWCGMLQEALVAALEP